MFRNRNGSFTPPHSLRRRQQSRFSEAGPPNSGIRPGQVLSGCTNQMLDLSICHPSQPFSNRFSVLATPPESSTKHVSHPREFTASNGRRTRNSRGTKEAKKRRDMRRNRRKLVAQLLNEQLSQAVDETLTKADCARPSPPAALPLPDRSDNAPSTSMVPFLHRPYLASVPPKIPMPQFSAFDVAALPELTSLDSASPTLRAPTPFRTLPKWCPRISSLTLGDVWRDCLPTFYDLSSLPESAPERSTPKDAAEKDKQCRDLQMWRPIGAGFGRHHSRFFPPKQLSIEDEQKLKTSDKAKVKLPPPVGCRLHASDRGIDKSEHYSTASNQAHSSMAQSVDDEARQQFKQDEELRIPATIYSDSDVNDFENSEAATLWRILVSENPSYESNTGLDLLPVIEDCAPEDAFNNAFDQPSHGHFSDRSIAELDGREVVLPYVHANSLTGYSNQQTGSPVVPPNKIWWPLQDSGISMPVVRLDEETNVGLNEMVVDHDIIGPSLSQIASDFPLPMSWPLTPPATPPLQPIDNIMDILPVDCIAKDEHFSSDAHFQSEQALFSQRSISPAPSVKTMDNVLDHSSINVADFLKLGHAKHCWCGHCEGQSYDNAAAEKEWSTSSSITLREQTANVDDDENESALSLIFNPSESEPDNDADFQELIDLNDNKAANGSDDVADMMVEEDDWLYFSPLTRSTQAANNGSSQTQPTYLPSSPILHLQRQERAPTPTIIITSDTSSDHRSDEYVTVSTSHIATPRSASSSSLWRNALPRHSSSAWETDLATFRDGMLESGLAKPTEGSWRWGREDAEEWWDWVVEEEC